MQARILQCIAQLIFVSIFSTTVLAHDNNSVADSESDDMQSPGWEMGIRIGDALLGWVYYFIQLSDGDPCDTAGNGAEFVSVDAAGNIYGGEPRPKKFQKYMRMRR